MPRAIDSFEGKTSILDGHYKYRKDPISKCYRAAKSKGYKGFAIQDDGQCFTTSTASDTFDIYEKSTLCTNGLGGPMANDVYLITKMLVRDANFFVTQVRAVPRKRKYLLKLMPR